MYRIFRDKGHVKKTYILSANWGWSQASGAAKKPAKMHLFYFRKEAGRFEMKNCVQVL